MAVNRAALVETINRRRNKDTSGSPTKAVNLRLAPAEESGGRVRRLVDLASSLMREAQVLARDKAFADESASLQTLDLAKGIDFYDEVQRFETALIKLALEQAEGNQARAARLLGLRATTLNSKIKVYDIQY
ncbi:MAG: Response regulator containing CheY-like receiver, AAA-type ATPase, and DNA-binding domain [Acidobacteria bacterium]|nr:Response regulator containing CheY-like receiver, AAA-type ATPase, and DNA-binding domain [Acidobacteriota bacterium]